MMITRKNRYTRWYDISTYSVRSMIVQILSVTKVPSHVAHFEAVMIHKAFDNAATSGVVAKLIGQKACKFD